MSSPGNNNSSLRPGWYKGSGPGGGKGFQPPPTVPDRGEKARASSVGTAKEASRDSNKFAALLDDDDGPGLDLGLENGVHGAESKPPPVNNSRSEAFRSSFNRSASTGTKPSGRSLADLAARVPEGAPGISATRRQPPAYEGAKSGGTTRFSAMRASDPAIPSGMIDSYKPDPKIIRYTREKLLSLRPALKGEDPGPPECLKELEGSVIISPIVQDPVCWDTFDAEEIWESVRERRPSQVVPTKPPGVLEGDLRRRNAPSNGRWQRGVALPPPEEARRREREADNPNELWDDPVGGVIGAASDFSSFGALPAGEDDDNVFDFEKMTEASRKLEEEIHGVSKIDVDDDDHDRDDDESEMHSKKKVDISRPLASAGTTLVSGSGDDVNVFEDFDTPSEPATELEPDTVASTESDAATPAVRGGEEDPSASSRLMKMIGVSRQPTQEGDEASKSSSNPWGAASPNKSHESSGTTTIDPIIGSIGGGVGVSLNPWGDPVASTSGPQSSGGMDLGIHLGPFDGDQKSREIQITSEREKMALQEAEMRRRRLQEEEAQRRSIAQQKAELERQQQPAAQQQPSPQQSQIELVLMERICVILENSWGQSDLGSVLSTLHAEDSRVIPLLSNVDSLRALVARSPHRVALRRDPGFGGDMAVLLMTNAQWQQQQQQQQVQARMQQEELQRRQLEKEAVARAQAQQAQGRLVASINHESPWFYSDPQNNIQGPFRGEEMRQWLEAGYFKGDLPISQVSSGPFHPLSLWFPDLNFAFRAQAANNGGSRISQAELKAIADAEAAGKEKLRREAEAQAAAERERRAAEEADNQRKAMEAAVAAQREAELREATRRELERQRQAKAGEAIGATNGGNEPSTQLKMMLGLSSGDQGISGNLMEEQEYVQPGKNNSGPDKRNSKASARRTPQKTVDISQPVPPIEYSVQAEAPAPVAPPPPAWGGAANAQPKKSMNEIQQEEARAAAILAAKRGSMPQPSSGWANVAAGTSGWSSGTLRTTPSAGGTPATLNAMSVQSHSKPQQPMAQGGASRKVAPITQQQRAISTGSSTPAEEFGTTMSPGLEKWCKEKMYQINGSEDLTLIAFCMTLNDANEIRQYLTTYLGSTPQVSSFATEFVNKRGLGVKQEEWETPGSAKKGRKKKAGR